MIFNNLIIAVAAAAVFLTLQVVESVPTKSPKVSKRAMLLSWAPVVDDMDGVHLINNNDVDTATAKNAYILLSKPRSYYDGMKGCASMGEGSPPKKK